jgi:hypothetical protein
MRIIALGMLLAGVLISASCGCKAGVFIPPIYDSPQHIITRPPWIPGPSPVRQLFHEYVDAELCRETAAPREAVGLFNYPVLRAAGMLPRVPEYVGTARTAAAAVEYECLGVDTHLRGGSVDEWGNSLAIGALAGEVSWAVYEVGAFQADGVETTVHVETSAHAFSGENQGYWVGLANYNRQAWETKALTTEADYSRAFPSAATYLNGGNLYVFVLVADGQSMLIDRVSVEMKYSDWEEVTIDTGSNVGWTPAVDFTITDNPLVVYSDYDTGKPMWAVGNRDNPNGILDAASWIISEIDSMPEGIATWLDVVVDPVTGMPRVSMCYTNIASGAENSRVGMSVLFEVDQNLSWWNYYLGGWVDGATYTSIDRHPTTGAYGIASNAANSYNTDEPAFDMHYRTFQINDPADFNDDGEVSFTRNFDDYFLFPHLRYHPVGGNGTVCVNGGYTYYQDAIDSWQLLYDISNSSSHGSIAYNLSTNTLGQSYTTVLENPDSEDLTFVDYEESFLAFDETVSSLPTPVAGTHIGRSSQIAFAPDGTPGIAYTEEDDGEVNIHYAYMVGDAWAIETVSNDPSTPSATNPLLLVDLAYDTTGTAALCYNHIVGTTSTMRVALRGL